MKKPINSTSVKCPVLTPQSSPQRAAAPPSEVLHASFPVPHYPGIMAYRSQRHCVLSARSPIQAFDVLYLWGRGAIGCALRGYLYDEHAGISEHDEVARRLAVEHGCPLDLVCDA